MTATMDPALDSLPVKNLPLVIVRAVTSTQPGVVPTIDVDSEVDPLYAVVVVVETGATLRMSGQVFLSASAAASFSVSGVVNRVRLFAADPAFETVRPELAPEFTMIRFEPSLLIWLVICCCAPCPRPTVSMTEAMPIRMPSMVRAERILRPMTAVKAVRTVSRKVIRATLQRVVRHRSAPVAATPSQQCARG